MDNNQITVLALFKVKPDCAERFRRAALKLLAPTRAEGDCIRYDFHQLPEDESRFMFYETWTGKAGLDKHFTTDHINEFRATVRELTEEKEITIWEKLDDQV